MILLAFDGTKKPVQAPAKFNKIGTAIDITPLLFMLINLVALHQKTLMTVIRLLTVTTRPKVSGTFQIFGTVPF